MTVNGHTASSVLLKRHAIRTFKYLPIYGNAIRSTATTYIYREQIWLKNQCKLCGGCLTSSLYPPPRDHSVDERVDIAQPGSLVLVSLPSNPPVLRGAVTSLSGAETEEVVCSAGAKVTVQLQHQPTNQIPLHTHIQKHIVTLQVNKTHAISVSGVT